MTTSLRKPPIIDDPNMQEISDWLNQVYDYVVGLDIRPIRVTVSESAPSGGSDGDLHIRKDTTNTALYININGSWSAYTNP